MADRTDDDKPVDVPGEAEPEWVTRLIAKMEELPGKVVANVTDEDRRTIAEQVHDLFDGSGAFKTEDQADAEKEKEKDTVGDGGTEVTPDEAPPKKRGRFSHLAQKFAGD